MGRAFGVSGSLRTTLGLVTRIVVNSVGTQSRQPSFLIGSSPKLTFSSLALGATGVLPGHLATAAVLTIF